MDSSIEADIKLIKNLYERLSQNGAKKTAKETLEILLGYRPKDEGKTLETIEAFMSGKNAYKNGQAASEVNLITPHLRQEWLKGWQLAASRTADHAQTLEDLIEDYVVYADLCNMSANHLKQATTNINQSRDQQKQLEECAQNLHKLAIEFLKIGEPNFSTASLEETHFPEKSQAINLI